MKKIIHFLENLSKVKTFYSVENATFRLDSYSQLNFIEFRDDDLTVKVVDFKNLELIKGGEFEIFFETFRKFLKQNYLGVFALKNKIVVGYAWSGLKKSSKVKYNNYMKIRENEAFIFYCRTSLSVRGKNIYPRLLSEICSIHFNENNASKIWIDTEVNNLASQKGIEKVGFSFVENVIYYWILGKFSVARKKKGIETFKEKNNF